MNEDFDTSQLHWWRCVAIDPNDKIQTFVVKIETDNIYGEFNKIRRGLIQKGLRFVEAKPITKEEVLAAEKLARFKARRNDYSKGLNGRRYSPPSHWRAALFVLLSILLGLLLVYLR